MAVLGRRIQDFIKKKFHRWNTTHAGGGVPKGHVIVYVGEEEKEYCVSSKCWDAMQLLRDSQEQNLRCFPDVSPHEFEIHLNHAKLVVKKRVKPYVPEVGLLEEANPKFFKGFDIFTFTKSTTFLTL